jgi:predicted Zn-dependent protease
VTPHTEGLLQTSSCSSAKGLSVAGVVTSFPWSGGTWRIGGIAPSAKVTSELGSLTLPSRSFSPLEPGDADAIDSNHLHVVRASQGEALERLSLRTDNAWSVLETAINNGIFSDHRFEHGDLVKVAKTQHALAP